MSYCPCGATLLSVLQKQDQSSSDGAPTCGRRCGKKLPCSTPGEQHICRSQCHHGPCPTCTKSRIVQCSDCKKKIRVDCQEIEKMEQYICEKCFNPCNGVMKYYGHNECGNQESESTEHDNVCNKRLSCGNHHCDQPFHSGDCKNCTHTSIQKLECSCGEEVVVPCGAALPTCKKPCTRTHACNHEVTHTCHNKERCPPCNAPTEKMCVGGHKRFRSVPCFKKSVTCDTNCGKTLPCGKHQCKRKCHGGSCESSCKESITLKCKCGKKKQQALCFLLKSHATLECDRDCLGRSTSKSSRDGNFKDFVRVELKSFIDKVKKGNMKPKYTFGPTTSYNRWIIHEIATEYGCTSESHGVEPDRYTVVTYKK